MKKIIGGHNSKVLKDEVKKNKKDKPKDKTKKECSCKKEVCPLEGKCESSESIVYQATVTVTDPEETDKETYLG